MKRVRSALAAACALLCVLAIVLWVRGYFASDTVGFGLPRPDGTLSAGGFMSGRGGLGFAVVIRLPYQKEIDGPFYQRQQSDYAGGIGKEPVRWGALGFLYVRLPNTSFGRGWAVAAPLWSLLLLLAPWPVWHLRAALRDGPERRRRRGLCVRCGYDLRASADRCPECGEPKPVTPASKLPAEMVPTSPQARSL